MSPIRKIALVILAAALSAGLGLLYWSSRTETAYIAAHPLARYQQIALDDLIAVPLSRNRPAEFQAITNPVQLVGFYATTDVVQGALFTPALVVAEPPTLRTFATGKVLPAGQRGYPLTIATDLAPVLHADDLVDLVMIDPLEGTATWMLSNVEPLYMVNLEDGRSATYILALAPEQVAVVEGALADAQNDQSGAYPKLVLSQSKNPALDPLTEFRYRELSAPVQGKTP